MTGTHTRRTDEVGTIYLLHFSRPFGHAKHYLGWARNLEARLRDHESGQGARLTQVVREAGITWELVRTWEGTRTRERSLKKSGGRSRKCPICIAERRSARGAA